MSNHWLTALRQFGQGKHRLGRSDDEMFGNIRRTIDPAVWRAMLRSGKEYEVVYFCPASHYLLHMG